MTLEDFRFGDCVIRLAARELLRDGRRVNLSPVVFDCIAYLIRHRERAVGRDELVSAVWGKAGVSDTVMGKTILTARRAIGDTAEEQRYLRTVPRFGYQWVAPMEEDVAAPTAPIAHEIPQVSAPAPITQQTPPPSPAPTQQQRNPRTLIPALAIAAVLLLIAAVLASRWHGAQESSPHAPPVSAALPAELTVVLPVEVAASPGDEWMRLGLMDLIASRLRAGGLAVLPSDNVVRLVPSGTSRDGALAAVAGVAERSHVVAAQVRHSGDDWIVRADVIEADGRSQSLETQAHDAMSAAALAADRILEVSGRRIANALAHVAPTSETELIQRVDAARLAGDPAQARALIDAASAELRARPEVQLRVAMIDLRTGEFEAARARLAALANAVSPESDALLHARVQNYLCIALARVGRMDDAERACSRAVALFETQNQPADLGRAYSDRGIVQMLMRQSDAAARDFARARIALNVAGDALQLAKVDGNESNLDMQQGRYGEAAAIQQRIGERFERFGMINELATALNNQTTAHLALLEPLDALKSSDRAFALLARVTDASVRSLTRLQRAEALVANGRLAEARVLLDESIAESSDAALAPDRAQARAIEAHIDFDGGQACAALLLARQAVAALPAPPYGEARADAWLLTLRSLHALGRIDQAASELKAFADAATSEDNPDVRLLVAIAQAEQADAGDHPDAARALYQDALVAAQRRGVPAMLAQTVQSYGRFLLRQHDLAQAAGVIGLVARHAEHDFEPAVLQAQLYRALGRQDAAEAAVTQARKLAGEREIPVDLSLPASNGNSADVETEHKRNGSGIVAPPCAG